MDVKFVIMLYDSKTRFHLYARTLNKFIMFMENESQFKR